MYLWFENDETNPFWEYGCVTSISFLFKTSDIVAVYPISVNSIALPTIEPVHAVLSVVVNLYEVGNLKSDIEVASTGTIGVPFTNPFLVTFANVVENKGFTISVIDTLGLF